MHQDRGNGASRTRKTPMQPHSVPWAQSNTPLLRSKPCLDPMRLLSGKHATTDSQDLHGAFPPWLAHPEICSTLTKNQHYPPPISTPDVHPFNNPPHSFQSWTTLSEVHLQCLAEGDAQDQAMHLQKLFCPPIGTYLQFQGAEDPGEPLPSAQPPLPPGAPLRLFLGSNLSKLSNSYCGAEHLTAPDAAQHSGHPMNGAL